MKFALSPGAAKAILRHFDYVRHEMCPVPSATPGLTRRLADCAFSDDVFEFELDFATTIGAAITARVLRESLKRAMKDDDCARTVGRLLRRVLSAIEDALDVPVVDRLAGLA